MKIEDAINYKDVVRGSITSIGTAHDYSMNRDVGVAYLDTGYTVRFDEEEALALAKVFFERVDHGGEK
jgi:hypothetical protein